MNDDVPLAGLRLAQPEDEHAYAEWEAAAAAVLRKAGRLAEQDPDAAAPARLSRTTLDGIAVPALGLPGEYDAGVRPTRNGAWDIRTLVSNPDAKVANEEALLDLDGGATSVWLHADETTDLAAVLHGVLLDLAPVVLDAPTLALAVGKTFLDVAAGGTLHPDTNLGADPLGAMLRGLPLAPDEGEDELKELAQLARREGIRALVVDATAAHDLGSSEAQELGWSLAVGVAYLRMLTDRGLSVAEAAGLMEFRYAATDEQLPTIAKLRAARRTWARVLELSGVPVGGRVASASDGVGGRVASASERIETPGGLDTPSLVPREGYSTSDGVGGRVASASETVGGRVASASERIETPGERVEPMRIHATTSRPMLSAYDAYVNMLRGTVAAFAAGVGGADAVTVLPFDAALGRPSPFGRRIARNVSHLLIDESHVAAVTDPAGGAYAVEQLTADLAAAAWAEFQRIEAEWEAGEGFDAFRGRIADVVAAREAAIARRKHPITGLSEFPNLAEERPVRDPDPLADSVRRYGASFEALRDEPVADRVFLATLGPVAQHTARASFAANLLAAGGIGVDLAGATSTPDDLRAAYDGQRVVCLAGSDQAYGAWGEAAASALREAGAKHVIIAGQPVDYADDACAVGQDALAFLTDTREKLQ